MNNFKCYTEYSRAQTQQFEFECEFNGTPLGGDTIMHNEQRWIVERREWRDAELVLIIREPGGLVR